MRWLASRFIDDPDYLEELGILTPDVRARKEAQEAGLEEGNGSGNGHAKAGNGSGNGHAEGGATKAMSEQPKPAASAMTDTPPVRPAALSGPELGPACDQCGGMMQRTGSCYTCSSCGNNTGCG
jgi:ribonucleoside-diphosphate reductase alpha chain